MIDPAPRDAGAPHRRAPLTDRHPASRVAIADGAFAFLLIAATLLAYAPALRGDYLWDDDRYLSRNPFLVNADGLRQIWLRPGATDQYYPLVFTTFWLEKRAWGDATLGYHLVNVFLHAGSAVLLRSILRRLGIPGAGLAALAFALHPVHVESVAWITERKNVLSGFCYLASLFFYCQFAGLQADGRAPGTGAACSRSRYADYGWSLLLFTCALLSKTVTATLPGAILLITWWKHGRLRWADVAPIVPFLVLGAVAGLVTAGLEQKHVGAVGPEWHLSAIERTLIAGRALWFYLGKLAWPTNLCFVYPRWTIDSHQWEQYVLPASALLLPVMLWLLRDTLGRGALVAALFFGGTLLPALGFLNVYPMRFSFVADHFQYLASLGPIVLVAAWIVGANRRWLRVSAYACIALLAALTFRHSQVYRDSATLWTNTLKKNPGAWLAHNNLGILLSQPQQREQSIEHFRSAIRLNPQFFEAHYNLANRLRDEGQVESALAQYREATRIRPDYVDAHYNLGCLLETLNRLDDAASSFQSALSHAPGDADAHFKLGDVEARRGRWASAAKHYAEALRIRPGVAAAHRRLADALAELGRAHDAASHYQQALRLRPAYAEAIRGLRRLTTTQDSTPSDR